MPIFVVGFARSGTTLCQRLVSQHLGLPTLPETHFFERLHHHDPVRGQLRSANARNLLQDLAPFLDFAPGEFDRLLAAKRVSIRNLLLTIVAGQIGDPAAARKGLWVEKTPGHALHMPLIHQLFPKAKFIWMVRHPLNSLASLRELREPGKGWSEDWHPIEVLCQEWSHSVHQVLDFQRQFPAQVLQVTLESLSAQPDAEMARVAEFADAVQAPAAADSKIIQPFEVWKAAALGAVDPAVADRSGRSRLDGYESWRAQTLLAADMQTLGYAATPSAGPSLDDLHQRMLATVEWYRVRFAEKDWQLHAKAGRIRRLLAKLQAAPAGPVAPDRPA
jgi:hypothetical protein